MVRPKLLAFALFPFLVGAAHVAHLEVKEERAQWPKDEDLLYLPPPSYLHAMSLGYNEALSDLIWVRAIIFAGDRLGARNFDWISRYLESIVSLTPTFRRPYLWGGVTAIYAGGKIDQEMVDMAIRVYRQGLHHFPEDHEMLFALGMLLTRDVQTTSGYTDEYRREAKIEGAELIRRAAAFGAPPLVRQLAATLTAQGSSDALAIQFLEQQLLQAEDEDYRRVLRAKLEEMVGSEGLARVERLRAAFEAERRETFPFVPEATYAVIRDER